MEAFYTFFLVCNPLILAVGQEKESLGPVYTVNIASAYKILIFSEI